MEHSSLIKDRRKKQKDIKKIRSMAITLIKNKKRLVLAV